MPAQPSVLLVDDDALLRSALGREFRAAGCEFHEAGTAEEAKQVARRFDLHLIVSDLCLVSDDKEDRSGLGLIADLREIAPAARIIALTGYGSGQLGFEASQAGAHDYLEKPVTASDILAAYDRLRISMPPPPPSGSLDQAKRDRVDWALKQTGNNVTRAACLLQIDRRTLQRMMKKMGFPAPAPVEEEDRGKTPR